MEKLNFRHYKYLLFYFFILIANVFIKSDVYILIAVLFILLINYIAKLSFKLFFLISLIMILFATVSFYLKYNFGILLFGNYAYLFLLAGSINMLLGYE